MKSAPPATGLGRKRQTNMSGAPGVDGCFYTLYFEEKFLKEFTLVKYKGDKWEKMKQRQFCDRFTVSKKYFLLLVRAHAGCSGYLVVITEVNSELPHTFRNVSNLLVVPQLLIGYSFTLWPDVI